MKSKIKRLLALVLCLTMILNGNVSLLASDETTAEDQVVTEAVEEIMEEVAEEATEEAAEAVVEEVVEEETIEAVAEETEVQEVNNDEVVEKVADEEKDAEISLQTELNGTIITMSGPKSSFPAGTDYSVSASELSEKALSDVEASLRKVELETEEKIASYKAYDIKLIVDGKEAQPVGDVNVTFQGAEVKEQVAQADSVEVYHVDEAKQEAVEVKGDVKNNEVVMTTDHFSTYVITTTQAKVEVTVEHYLIPQEEEEEPTVPGWRPGWPMGPGGNTGSGGVEETDPTPIKLYSTKKYEITANQTLENIAIATNYDVVKVVRFDSGGNEVEISGEDLIDVNSVYRVYYSPKEGELDGDVQLFDYQVKPTTPNTKSINDASNYPVNSDVNTRVTMGKNSQNNSPASNYKPEINNENVNDFTGGSDVLENIISGVDYISGALVMGNCEKGLMYEPGFFTNTEVDSKQVLSGYSLKFNRNGDTYELDSILKEGTPIIDAGSDFWPLNDIVNDHPDSANTKTDSRGNRINFFFGMRYDIKFTIGDYVGPLNYTFKGDDDLWVVLDAKDSSTGGKVIVDIGGIHQAHEKTVDIWEALNLNPENMSEQEKNKEHTLTILYLERGGEESNCNMEFTLPNSKVVTPIQKPVNFQFNKINSSGAAVKDATFELYDSNNKLIDTAVSDGEGVVTFNDLHDGTYFIKETKAPAGYVKDSKIYKLTIEDSEPTMTLEGSADSITSIVNHTLIENIDYDKTVSVHNYDSRIYKIVLSAKTKYEHESIQASEIVDVIDSRFTLTDECKTKLENNKNVQVTETNGETTIKWSGDAAIITKEGWKQEIYIQAKSDFIGGNAIPTNGPASGIKVGNDTVSFPQPSVNVKLLDFAVTDHEITVYKGDIVNTTEFANVLAKSLKVTKLYDTKDDQFEVLSDGLSQAQLKTLNETKTLEIPYSYKGTEDVEGKFTLKLVLDPNTPDNKTKGEEAISDSHAEMVSGKEVEIYRLEVSYKPLFIEDRMALEVMKGITQPAVDGGTVVVSGDLGVKQADYIVNVISGEIQITKTLDKAPLVDTTFTFYVKEIAGNIPTQKVEITVLKDTTNATYKLTDLPRGTYTITEEEANGYSLETVEVDTDNTNTKNSVVKMESATFVLGTVVAKDGTDKDVIQSYKYTSGGILGSVIFTNEKVYKDWSIVKRSSSDPSLLLAGAEFELKLVDGKEGDVWYKGISQSDGSLKWLKNGTSELGVGEYIVKGVYTLTETKAPAGYSKTDLTWTVTIASKGYLKSIEASDKDATYVTIYENGKFTFFIENTPLYELPHSGGLGIYTYTIGGILLMAFATLILYKNRRKEVLARY